MLCRIRDNEFIEILLDASAIIAVIADQPESEFVLNCTQNVMIVSPNIISCEIANALTRMMRKNIIISKEQMIDLVKNLV